MRNIRTCLTWENTKTDNLVKILTTAEFLTTHAGVISWYDEFRRVLSDLVENTFTDVWVWLGDVGRYLTLT